MTDGPQLPRGGIDARKYAAACLALGLARGALIQALMNGNMDEAQRILDITSTAKIAQALGCNESELAIDWNEFLTPDEVRRIEGW